ncbi:hypothetical protein BHM03_00013176 [Ensete ventricosum]|nr:hypothetical protein BHM03_00013176 [Ensete ventricosum]
MAPNMKARGKGKQAGGKPSRAYVTFLAGDGDYVKGAVGLAKGLRKVGSAYPLVVAVLPDVPESHRHLLASQGCIVREIEPKPEDSYGTIVGLPEHVLQGYLQANPVGLQPGPGHAVEAPGERGAGEGEGGPLLRCGTHPSRIAYSGSKPWRFTGKEANMDREDIKVLVKRWWDIYHDESLDYKGPPVTPKQPLRGVLSEAGAVKYVTAPSAA